MKTPLILDIKGNSLDDGPGIRSVVFFKGCPLSCFWCHNPESKKMQQEIAFESGECIACDTCISVCPEQALSRDNPFFIDRSRCTLCFQCADQCPSNAIRPVGSMLSVDDILAGVMKDKPFFDTSGGGVTFSGGEPTLYMDFLAELARKIREQGIHVLLETCGLFDFQLFSEKIHPHVDTLYMDIKLMNNQDHLRYCGVENTRILDNFQKLSRLYAGCGKELLPRIPLIPGITDSKSNLSETALFLLDCGAQRVSLLPYHPLWQEKNRTIGIGAIHENQNSMASFLPRERMEACRSIFVQKGITIV
ncbi:MAG: glycyl-radical enzyme activating protein [Pseudomonadota bacterium]